MSDYQTSDNNYYQDHWHSAAFIDRDGQEVQITQQMIQNTCDDIEKALIKLKLKQTGISS